jgi:hypothetical protein
MVVELMRLAGVLDRIIRDSGRGRPPAGTAATCLVSCGMRGRVGAADRVGCGGESREGVIAKVP